MKLVVSLLVLLIAAPFASGCDEGGRSEAAANVTVSSAEAHALVAQGATLLDVRTPGEWAGGHVSGAVLIPVQELDGRLAELPRDKPIVVYCASGVRSARAVEMLRAAGYDARDLGGMSRWGG